MSSVENNVTFAKYAEQMERYEDMAKYMREYAEANSSLGQEERNLLSVAYKNVVGTRRMAWRTVTAIGKQKSSEITDEYRKKIEDELVKICNEVKTLLNDHLLKENDKDVNAQVFYLKMLGDYCRYQAEVVEGDEIKTESQTAYEKATEVASTLDVWNPLRLGLALNYSVFYYEIMEDRTKACEIAEQASDKVHENPPDDENDYKDSALIHQLLRDNLTLWKQADEEDD